VDAEGAEPFAAPAGGIGESSSVIGNSSVAPSPPRG